VVKSLAGTEVDAGGELRGGDGFGRDWGSGLWWFPIKFEGWGGSVRSRGRGWWYWMDGEGSGCGARHRNVAAATLFGDGEESFPPSIAGRGGSRGRA
jgi:hypothetical protein